MSLFGNDELVLAVRELGVELKRIREILEPNTVSGNSFRAGYSDPDGTPDAAWISQTDEVAGYLREQMAKAFGRPLTDEEEIDNGILPRAYDGQGRASNSVDGFSTEPRAGAEKDQV